MWQAKAMKHPDFRPIVDALSGLALYISGGAAK
jgi:hypothetical protein